MCLPDITLFIHSALCPLLEGASLQASLPAWKVEGEGGQGTCLFSLMLWHLVMSVTMALRQLHLHGALVPLYCSIAYPFLSRGTNSFLLGVFVFLILPRFLQIAPCGVNSVSSQIPNCYNIQKGHEKQPGVKILFSFFYVMWFLCLVQGDFANPEIMKIFFCYFF